MRADRPEPPRALFPPIEPYERTHIDVGDGHTVYVEQSGKRNGMPVLFVHGGPGGGTGPVQRRFFDPAKYRIILFDQRGCGRSRPHASLDHNTTHHLIADMEVIRRAFGIDRWMLFGGSWGSTLALLYAQAYPERVTHLVLRGIFLMMERELKWFYERGTSAIFPEAWDQFIAPIPEGERGDIIKAYYQRLTSDLPRSEVLTFARAWSLWEGSTVTLVPDDTQQIHALDPSFALAFARIEAHYFFHRGFLKYDDQILKETHKIAHIPTHIVQGRYDAICPPQSAFELHRHLPNSTLDMIPVAGHSAFESGIQHSLINATDAFAS